MTKKELLNKLYTDYSLTSEDVFKHQQGWVILTRSGIEKVQAQDKIIVRYEVIKCEADFAVFKAITDKVETFGSAKKGAFKDGTTQSWYIAEMAEKRALSRAILKHTGMYQHGAFGEDEAEDFKDDRKHIPAARYSAAQSAILKGETTYDAIIEQIESMYIIGESQKHALKQIKPQ